MPVPPRPLPPPFDGAPAFTVGAARAAGVSRGRLRAADLQRPHRGVRQATAGDAEASVASSFAAGEDPGARDRAVRTAVLRRVAGYEPLRAPGAFYTGRTAVAIYDRLFDHDPGSGPLEVAVFAPERAPRVGGVRGIQLSSRLATVREVGGLAVASPATVWAGFANRLGTRDLVRLGDAFVRVPRGVGGRRLPQNQLATIAQLRAAADAPQRRGRAALDAALASIRVGSMSPLETDVRLDAAAAGLPEPLLDAEIRDERGCLVGVADAAYRAERVLVEVEGVHHRVSAAQWDRDIEKHRAYAALGWTLVRITGRAQRAGRAARLIGDALSRAH